MEVLVTEPLSLVWLGAFGSGAAVEDELGVVGLALQHAVTSRALSLLHAATAQNASDLVASMTLPLPQKSAGAEATVEHLACTQLPSPFVQVCVSWASHAVPPFEAWVAIVCVRTPHAAWQSAPVTAGPRAQFTAGAALVSVTGSAIHIPS